MRKIYMSLALFALVIGIGIVGHATIQEHGSVPVFTIQNSSDNQSGSDNATDSRSLRPGQYSARDNETEDKDAI